MYNTNMPERIYFFHDHDGARVQWLQELNAMSNDELLKLKEELRGELAGLDLTTREGAQEASARLIPDVDGWKYAVTQQILDERRSQE